MAAYAAVHACGTANTRRAASSSQRTYLCVLLGGRHLSVCCEDDAEDAQAAQQAAQQQRQQWHPGLAADDVGEDLRRAGGHTVTTGFREYRFSGPGF